MGTLRIVQCGVLLVSLCFAPLVYSDDQRPSDNPDKKEQKIEGPDLELSLDWIQNFLDRYYRKSSKNGKYIMWETTIAVSETTLSEQVVRKSYNVRYHLREPDTGILDDRVTFCDPCVEVTEFVLDLRDINSIWIDESCFECTDVVLVCKKDQRCVQIGTLRSDFYDAMMKYSKRELGRSKQDLMESYGIGVPGSIQQNGSFSVVLQEGAPAEKLKKAFEHVSKLLQESSKGSSFDKDLF